MIGEPIDRPADQRWLDVQLLKPLKGKTVRYQATLLEETPTIRVVRARWQFPAVDLGLLGFEPGDLLDEYFYTDRWYNIFLIRDNQLQCKGWYCNLTRPALFGADKIISEDLELDLMVSADRRQSLLCDEDEYAARFLERDEPQAHAAVWAAVAELQAMIAAEQGPFQVAIANGERFL